MRVLQGLRRITLAIAAIGALASQGASADSINLAWESSYNDKALMIESGADKLYEGKLEGAGLVVETDPMLNEGVASQPATMNVQGHDELAIGINLFRCGKPCKWRITFATTANPNSTSLHNICQTSPKNLGDQYKKYFFCRRAYQFYVAANDACWWESKAALSGWFDAAYALHQTTLRDGICFVARDLEVENLVEESLLGCTDFEQSMKRRQGYFKSMMSNLDIAVLQRTQRVERSLVAEKPAEARAQAAELVEDLKRVAPLRSKITLRDLAYTEGVINRALAPDMDFMLR